MRIAIVGAGAMGSVYAGLLAAAGNDVTAVDVDAAHVEAIRAAGLRVEGASGDRIVRIGATTDPAEVGVVDLVVIATKAFQARAAAESARQLLGEDTTVLTIQNGLGAADEVAEVVPPAQLLVGVAGGFGASIVAPGHAHHHGMELVRLGERVGPVTARTERIADVWREAGFSVRTYDDVERLLWEKLICNACYAGLCGLLETTIGEVIEDPQAWSIAVRCAQEALDVGRACGVALEIDDCATYVRDYGLAIAGARPSLLLDLLAGRPTEVEWINGSVPQRGATVGVPAPTNELITTLVLAKSGRRL
ncbi:MAG TPA: 2-dehydropantoate 2-reductase [Gaiellaceae bacterium]|nr:2-dehydropantoate 2-reductase [Gaiellaceae bacterium]